MQNLNSLSRLRKDKKALSQVVTTVLIILLALSAVLIIWKYTSSLIKQPLLSPQVSCLEMQSSKEIIVSKACYNSETNETEITLKRTALSESEINSINFIISNNEDSSSWVCSSLCGNCVILNPGEVKTYFLSTESTANNQLKVSSSNCILAEKTIESC